MKGPHWRIENDDQVVTNAKIIYVDGEGNETDVSHIVQKVALDLTIGEPSRATIHAIFVDSRVAAYEAEAVVATLRRPTKWGRWKAAKVRNLKGWVAGQLTPQLQREIAKNWKQRRI